MDQFEQYEGYVTIGMAQDKLKKMGKTIAIPTMRNWVNDMHQYKTHTIPRNSRGERIFSEQDLEIIGFIYDAKQRFGNNLTMQAICTMIQERFAEHLHYDPNFDSDEAGGSAPVLSEHRLREFLKDELLVLEQLKQEMLAARDAYTQKLELMPSAEEEAEKAESLKREIEENVLKSLPSAEERAIELRTYTLDKSTTENRVRKRLRQQAEALWAQNPKKVGFLVKREDIAAKLEFIQQYELDHFEEEIKKEYE